MPLPSQKSFGSFFCIEAMRPMTKAYLTLLAIAVATATAQQYVAFDAASATSTYSSGNLAGSSAFAAQQALSGGSGYWCDLPLHTLSSAWQANLHSCTQVLKWQPWRRKWYVLILHDFAPSLRGHAACRLYGACQSNLQQDFLL